MMQFKISILILLNFVNITIQVVVEDLVNNIPGWDQELYSNFYSGFKNAGNDGTYQYNQYYMFFESENDPEKDPVIVWTNGGPGAASVYGLFVEMGPYQFTEESLRTDEYNRTGIPSLFRNPYSWTTFANVLILNSGGPTAWSYCDPAGPSGNASSCGVWNDTKTAWVNANFLEQWANDNLEFLQNDWYLAGESYAGIYVPMLYQELFERDSFLIDNLRGFACGDACQGDYSLIQHFEVQFLHGHGQFSSKLNDQIQASCNLQSQESVTSNCQILLDKMQQQVGGYYNYGLYDTCYNHNVFIPSKDRKYWSRVPQKVSGALNDYPCGGNGALMIWVNQTKVKDALHVPQNAFFFSADNGAGFTYISNSGSVYHIYEHTVLNTSMRVLVYNGDTDPGLNSFFAEHWTSALGFEEIQPWTPWTIDGYNQIGGYVTRYKNDFDFLTIRGSGHMVPLFKPKESLEFMKKWIHNQDWLPYNPQKIQQ